MNDLIAERDRELRAKLPSPLQLKFTSETRVVRCRDCRHWERHAQYPTGIGNCHLNCALQGRSAVDASHPIPAYPNAPRYCKKWSAKEAANGG